MYPTRTLSQSVVLVADDNEINRRFVETVLKQKSATVLVATDGNRAVELSRSRVVDLILMDIRMPGMDGETAARIILSESENLPSRPIIIALTAEARPEEKERLLNAGFDNYLTKPVSRDDLLAAIEDSLARRPGTQVQDQGDDVGTLFDRDKALAALGHSEDLYAKLLGMFAKELPKSMLEITDAIEDGEYARARDRVHKLRSSASYTGAVGFQATAQQLEGALLKSQPRGSEIYGHYETLQGQARSLSRQLREMGFDAAGDEA